MANLEGFDATTVEPSSSFEVIPKGDYSAIMVDSEFKTTKSGGGEYLQCVWEIIDGEHKGRRLFDRLNLKNSNETAVRIAQGTLSAICHAVGVMRPKDSSELHNKPCLVKVKVEERKDQPGTLKNEVSGYEAINGKSVNNKKSPIQSEEKSEKPAGNKPPWKK